MMLFTRYSIKIKDNDWKDLENLMINELENILDIKINSHKELIEALEILKKNFRNYFLRLEDKLKLKFRESKDNSGKKDIENKEINKIGDGNNNRDDKGGGGGFRDNKKKKKKEVELLYF